MECMTKEQWKKEYLQHPIAPGELSVITGVPAEGKSTYRHPEVVVRGRSVTATRPSRRPVMLIESARFIATLALIAVLCIAEAAATGGYHG